MSDTSVINVEKNNRSKLLENLKKYFSEYSEKSGIHGLAYLGEQNRTIAEKYVNLNILTIF